MATSPLTTFRIATENLKQKPFRTVGQIFIVSVFSFMLFGGSILIESVRSGMESMSQRLGADLMVVPYGYEKQLQSALLRGEPSSFYLDQRLEEKIRQVPGVHKVSSQIYIASLRAACCALPVQLIGFDPDSDFVILPWMSATLKRPLADGEIIVGSKIEGKIGDDITFFGRPYKIAMRLDKTGMGFDTSVFMSNATARQIIQKLEIAPLYHIEKNDRVVSSLMVKAKPGQDVRLLANEILYRHATDFNLDMVMAKTMVSDISVRLQSFAWMIYAFAGVLWLVAIGVLTLVFSIVLNERKKEFSLLRIFGASRRKLAAILFSESLMISVTGSACGLFLSSMAVFPFSALISSSISLPFLLPGWGQLAMLGFLSMLVSLGIGPLSCLYSVWRLGRSDVYSTMQGDE